MAETREDRLNKLFPDGKGVFLAYDQGLEHGPSDFDGDNADPAKILEIADSGHFDGFICHRGIAEEYAADRKVPLILKLNGKTSLVDGEPVSKAIASVEDAVKFGADAVGYTVYVGSAHESEMLTEFGKILDEAHAAELPVFGWMYPRGGKVEDPQNPETIAYATRVGMELGADAIKSYYPGSPEEVTKLVSVAGRSRVVVAGGLKQSAEGFEKQVAGIIEAGAAGVAVGRNIWQDDDPIAVAKAIHREVHGS